VRTLTGIDIHITLLGYFRLLVDSRPLGAAPGRVPELIAYLILHPQEHHARRDLAFLFWPDTNEAQAQTNLRKLMHQLRATLPEVASLIQVEPRHLSWRADATFTCDVSMFEAALARAT
jgi:DNA-binding SARP family transcriptional activator